MRIFRSVFGTQVFDSPNDLSNNTHGETQNDENMSTIGNVPSTSRIATLNCARNASSVSGNPSTSQSFNTGTSVSAKPPTLNGIANGVLARDSSTKENTPSKEQPQVMPGGLHVHLKLLPRNTLPSNIARAPLRPVAVGQQNTHGIQRPVRNIKPIVRMNYDLLVCCICNKKIHVTDSTAQCDDGNIICSIKCFKKV